MSSPIQYNTGQSLLDNVLADYNAFAGGGTPNAADAGGTGAGGATGAGEMPDGLAPLLDQLSELLKKIAAMLGEGEGDDGDTGGGTGGNTGTPGTGGTGGTNNMAPIAGEGRIWGDPHFEGQDGGKYDVQGEAGKTYNLFSDQGFQMNGQFDQWKNKDGLTVVGEVGISVGQDQISFDKHGKGMVNGEPLNEGDRVELADGGYAELKNGQLTVQSEEYTTTIDTKGSGNAAYLDIRVKTDNAVADGVPPQGLLGQTFDADDDARNGAKGKGAQGEGAIVGTYDQYEVTGLYDRNFDAYNSFFTGAEAATGGDGGADGGDGHSWFSEEVQGMLASAFASIGQSMLMFQQGMLDQNTAA